MTYEVMYTLDGQRDFEEFTNKREALTFARKTISKGGIKVFLDKYDIDHDLIDFWFINKNGEIKEVK